MPSQSNSQGSRCVVVGGGQAGAQTATSLRQAGWQGEICVFGEENRLPYQRPLASKGYLAGKAGSDQLPLRPASSYDKLGIRVTCGAHIEAVDRKAQAIRLGGGSSVHYDVLVLATGSRPRRLALPGADTERVLVLRTADDADTLRRHLRVGERLVIVGGGYLGLEVASVVARLGAQVTVLEAAPNLLARVAGTPIAEFFAAAHRSEGVTVVTGARVTSLWPAVCCADGSAYPADAVVVAVGAEPRVELARDAGLACRDGIVVDEFGRTEDPVIFATGDCTNHPSGLLKRRLRLESVGNAVEQSKAVAATVAGSPTAYSAVPWFWSDQYEHKLQSVGIAGGHDRLVVNGDPADGSFSVTYFERDEVVAVDAVNAPREFVRARALLGQQVIESLTNT